MLRDKQVIDNLSSMSGGIRAESLASRHHVSPHPLKELAMSPPHRNRILRSARRALRPQVGVLEPRLVPAVTFPSADSHGAAIASNVGEIAMLDGSHGHEQSLAAQTLGTIQVSRSAGGQAIRVLRKGFKLTPLRAGRGSTTGPIVVGVTELTNRRVVQRLIASYEAGQAVGVTNPGRKATEWLRQRLDDPHAVFWDTKVPRASLVVFRNVTLDGDRTRPETTVLLPRESVSGTRRLVASRQAVVDRGVFKDLSVVFASPPAVTEAPSGSSNLLDLANSYLTREIRSNDIGDAVQIINTVVAARSFLNKADFYYVLQEVDYRAADQRLDFWAGDATTRLTVPSAAPTVIQPSPQTTLNSTSITSGVDLTIGGSVGFDQGSGLNASLSASSTISQSKTVTYEPIDVTNRVNPSTGVTAWSFSVRDAQRAAGSTNTFFNQWVWQIPFTAYAAGQSSVTFQTQAEVFKSNQVPISPAVTTDLTSTVPIPFGNTFSLQSPRVDSVSSSTVRAGSTFTIKGSGLYPSLITAVLIGGTPLPAGNFQSVSDTAITVVAPKTIGHSQPVVVQTTQGVSNDNVKITIKP
jgi:hypothetical protein